VRWALHRVAARLALACCLLWSVAGPGFADPFGAAAKHSAPAASLVELAHGFHCRPMLGWDPVAGLYRVHSHPGICRNYSRCYREHQRCIFILGGGFEPWTYERFGHDNYRYYGCMIRSGCY
jgi:hypothetical protein